ncbi:hypothetical protein ACROYT_G004746 [Oculina patagonica]
MQTGGQDQEARQQDGLEFKNWKPWLSSLHGYRLAGIQKGPKGQGKAKDLLFRMIYEDGKHVSNVDTLIEAAKELSLEGAGDYLKSLRDLDLILSEDSCAKSQMKISGVPYFVISDND